MSGGELLGDPALKITGAASLAEAVPGEITFFSDPRYGPLLRKTRAAAVFVPLNFSDNISAAQIRVANPSKAFEQVVFKFAPGPISFAPGIHPSAIVDPTAKLGARVSIQPYVVIEAGVSIGDATVIGAGTYVGHETSIGASCTIYPRVSIRERSRIGSRVIIHSGVVIGADGFGFEFAENRHKKIPQLGIVQIDDNVVIGKNSVVAAQTGISGSTRVGEHVQMGGQVGIVGHVTIADKTLIGAQSGVSKDIGGGVWFGYPAMPMPEAKRQIAWIRRLGKLFARVKEIEKKL